MRIVILGAPGAGKRTQSALLAEKLALAIVTTGDLLKQAIAEESELGLEVKALQDAGRVVTEDIILGLIREQLLLPAMADGFILDGFPRNLLQALTLDELLQEISQPLDLVLLIDIDNDHLMERLVGRRTCRSCGALYNVYRNPPVVDGVCDICGGRLHRRSDDNEETVSSRIHVFDHLIAPLITHYEKSGRLVRVDGNGSLETVFGHLLQAIEDADSDTAATSAKASKEVARSGQTSGSQAVTESRGESGEAAQRKHEGRASKPLKSAKRLSKQPSKKSAAKAAKTSKKAPQKRTKPSETKKAEASKPKRKLKESAKPAVRRAKVSSEKSAQVKKKKKISSKAKATAKVVKKSSSKRSKPVVSRKKTTQTKKKVSTKSRSKAKVVKKSVAKKRKPTTPLKKKVSVKTRTSVNTVKKSKSKATRKKAMPPKKKVAKKPLQATKTSSRKKLLKKKPAAKKTVKKQVTKTARKLLSKKTAVAKKKGSLKKSRGSQVKKVTAKSAKKQTGKKSLAKKAVTKKKGSASKKAIKKKLKK
ncbi:MAG: nucleoside monophosphate kinase [Candidatus Thiodiazotropha sp. (ex. Lucinisca nassula)]|nr:nucleoside monophosphate kinase [Candidatus Thiodiazotropha sp. (ex. Lucinisca nassula)]